MRLAVGSAPHPNPLPALQGERVFLAALVCLALSACQLGPLTSDDLIARTTCPATCPADQVCGTNGSCVLAARLTGSIVDSCTGQALDARVTIAGQSTCSGSAKLPYFSLIGLRPGGPYTLAVGKIGYRSYVVSRDLAPGDNTQSVISLEPSAGCPASPQPSVCVCEDSFCQP
ncbi:MAG: carboxypeptidase-like regulatory domain-containing protein [Archangium sp.]